MKRFALFFAICRSEWKVRQSGVDLSSGAPQLVTRARFKDVAIWFLLVLLPTLVLP